MTFSIQNQSVYTMVGLTPFKAQLAETPIPNQTPAHRWQSKPKHRHTTITDSFHSQFPIYCEQEFLQTLPYLVSGCCRCLFVKEKCKRLCCGLQLSQYEISLPCRWKNKYSSALKSHFGKTQDKCFAINQTTM